MSEVKEVIKTMGRMCASIESCGDCPIAVYCDYDIESMAKGAEELERIIIEWAKEHPVKTNLDKFKEVFPMIEIDYTSFHKCGFYAKCKCEHPNCDGCENKGFWLREYEEPEENNK